MRLITLFLAILISTPVMAASPLKSAFSVGTPDVKSMGTMTFGPEGVLLIGDSQSGAVFAIEMVDEEPARDAESIEVQGIDAKIAAMLGTTTEDIQILDMAVNPSSQNVYLSVSRAGVDLLLRVNRAGEITEVTLRNVNYASKALRSPVSMDAKSSRGQSLRGEAITDLVYSDGAIYVAGLSNEEFASTLRTMSFPFDETEAATSIEIYHAAHQQYETHAPIRTLTAYTLNQAPHVLASYTCTPLVTFPVEKLENGIHLMGKTVAEFGSGNRPLDMIVYQNDGRDYILLANSNRALMKVDPRDIETSDAITTPVTERFGTAGTPFIAINQVGVQQIDNLNGEYVLAVQRMSNGSLDLRSMPKSRL